MESRPGAGVAAQFLVAPILCLQAVLLFSNLNLLPIWGDEVFTFKTVRQPVPEILDTVKGDIHPPLYFLLLHVWPWHEIAGLRAFSGLWALVAVLLLDRLWVKSWCPRYRILALSLFAFSPSLLLYGRMARSYSMQTAGAIVTVWFLWRWVGAGKTCAWNGVVPAVVSTLVLLYVHYVPGIAILTAFAVVAPTRLGIRSVAVFLSAVTLGYLPWLLTLSEAMKRWGSGSSFFAKYTITGSTLLEQLVKAGYGAVALTVGESFRPLSLVLVPVILALALLGAYRALRAPARLTYSLAAMLLTAAAVGFLGVSRWVSYPFIAARLLWLLPFLSLAVAAGLRHVRAGIPTLAGELLSGVLVVAIGLSFASSTLFYFQQRYFLNKGYMAPVREIAGRLNRDAKPGDLILVDVFDTDAAALNYYLNGPAPLVGLIPEREATARVQVEQAGTVWMVRGQRDVSPGHFNSGMERLACASRQRTETDYLPFDGWQKLVIAAVVKEPAAYLYEMVQCSPAGGMIQ